MNPSLAFALAGLIGSALKSWVTNSQETFSKKSVADVAIGGLVGLLYPLFPVIPLPAEASLIQQAAMIALLAYFSSDFVTNILGKAGIKIPAEKLVVLLVGSLFLLGASCNSQQALMGSGTALKGVGQQWLAVNEAFVKGCLPSAPKLPKATCDQARSFGEKFKKSYPLAIDLYETAVNAKDTAMAADAKSVVRGLSRDLVKLGLEVGIQLTEVK